MNNLFFTWKKCPWLLCLALLPALAPAQTTDPMQDHFEQMLRRMTEQMRRGMPFDTAFQGGRLQIAPDSSSYFYFRIDTSFSGNGEQFFQQSPFENPLGQDFFGFDRFFDQFFNGITPPDPRDRIDNLPPDDGMPQENNPKDDLLPEERLRQQEKQASPQEQPTPKPLQPKVKTIRI